ncbi:MAG: hypothetical protein A2X45_03520 [Lentisphaerae bacterium GWF2_50_93]|nr:MAG: hypothetical protein A2X45_03520 [Lentisphaerae bacterium GWF2_50_93]
MAQASDQETVGAGASQHGSSELPIIPSAPEQGGDLPVVGSYENLKSLLEEASSTEDYVGGVFLSGLPQVTVATALGGQMLEQKSGNDTAGSMDYSGTNVQVEGVDEADIVKTDGTYIYQVNREKVVIVKALHPKKMEIIAVLNNSDKNFIPREVYVDRNHLVVIGSTGRSWDYPYNNRLAVMIMPSCWYYPREMVKAVVYNIEDKSNIEQVRELELNGSYVSSRKVGQSLYMIARKNLYFYRGFEIDEPKPLYYDSAIGDDFTEIDYRNIRYFPGFADSSYLIVAGFSLDRPDEPASVSSYLGSGQNIYASTQNLYVAVSSYRQTFIRLGSAIKKSPSSDMGRTRIYKFGMDEGRLTYIAVGKAPGTMLNQFSMDEHGEYFRIATTTHGNVWRSNGSTSKSNVYIFDRDMNIVGKVEGIAPGENMYSVRFVGDRGYMVTFKTVDPFFVLDLKDPRNPAILGELKIPGYSNYLHPYDENHIIGFGKDTVEVRGTAYYLGMKMALFDVSDVANPVEMFSEKIGDRGTDSELLRTHKALLFSKEKNLLAFPVRIMEVNESVSQTERNILEYGRFAFQGAYVYDIDLRRGFSRKGSITHLASEDYPDADNYWYGSGKDIERIIYIGDTLYTLSKGMIKANSLKDLREMNSLEIK